MVLIFNKTTLICALPKKAQPSAACRARSGSIMGLNIWCPLGWLARALGNWLSAQPRGNSHQIQKDGKHTDSAFSNWALGDTSEKYRYHQSALQQSTSSWHSLRIEDCLKHKLGLLNFLKVAAFKLLLALYKMSRPCLIKFLNCWPHSYPMAEILENVSFWGLLQLCHLPAPQILKLRISKLEKTATNLPSLFLNGFATLLSAVKTSLHPQAAAFSCCSCFPVSPCPRLCKQLPCSWAEREGNQASELFLHSKQPLHGSRAGESPRKLLGGWRKERRNQDQCSKALLRGRAEGVWGCCWVDLLGWFWGLALLHGCAFNLFQRCLEPYKSAYIVRKRFSSQWILNSECNENAENVLIEIHNEGTFS